MPGWETPQRRGFAAVAVWKESGAYQARSITMGTSVADLLWQGAVDSLAITRMSGGKPYHPGSDQEDAPYLVVEEDDVLDDKLLDVIRPGTSLHKLKVDDLQKHRLFCYALVLPLQDDSQLILLKHGSPLRAFGKKPIAGFFTEMVEVIDSPIFVFDTPFDVVAEGNLLFALNKDKFEALFKDDDVVNQAVAGWVASAFGTLPVRDGDLEKLVERMKKNSVTKRLIQSVLRQPHITGLTLEGFIDLAEAGKYDISQLVVDNRITITRENERDVLYVMNEDFGVGSKSGHRYRYQKKVVRAPHSQQE